MRHIEHRMTYYRGLNKQFKHQPPLLSVILFVNILTFHLNLV